MESRGSHMESRGSFESRGSTKGSRRRSSTAVRFTEKEERIMVWDWVTGTPEETGAVKRILVNWRKSRRRRLLHAHPYRKHVTPAGAFFYSKRDDPESVTWCAPHVPDRLGVPLAPRDNGQMKSLVKVNAEFQQQLSAKKATRQQFIDIVKEKHAEGKRKRDAAAALAVKAEFDKRWGDAFEFAREAGELNMLNKDAGDFPDQIYSFHETYGRPLKALRFVAHGLDRFPDKAGIQLTQLTQLTLASNRLTELPDSICQLAKLSALNLLRNRLEVLPERLGDLVNLRSLDIATNRLQTLPLTFGNLTRVEKINADCNLLRRIPETLSRMTCHTLSFNRNKLVALPRCLANMVNLTALSANDNSISFLPNNFGDSRSLTTVKLCANIIEELPESISRLPRLKSLWLDHNEPMSALPWNFYMLTSLVELRLDGNAGMLYPTQDVLVLGAEQVRAWFKKRQKQALFARKHRVVATMHDFMEQLTTVQPCVAHPGYFEAQVERSGAVWYQIVWSKFWDEMLPGLRDAWAEKRVDKHRVTAMPFARKEVQKVLEDYKDAEGRVYVKEQVCLFKRCRCVDANGNRKVCVPPKPGWMCKRRADLFKCRVILMREKQLIDERKREQEAIRSSVENARADAKAYCHSEEGIERFRNRAAKRASIEMDQRRKADFHSHHDKRLKRQLEAINKRMDEKDKELRRFRDKAEAELYRRLKEELEPRESSTEGYAQEKVKAEIKLVLETLKHMPEDRDIRHNERARQRALRAAREKRAAKEWHPASGLMKLFDGANALAEAELAEELSHDLHRRHTDKQLVKAEKQVKEEHVAMRRIQAAWGGMGALEVFRAWRKWAKKSVKRRTKDKFCAQRDELKWAADCVAALELAQWTIAKYVHYVDEWSDEPYWVHSETNVTVWDEPTIIKLLPEGMAEKFPARLDIDDERTWGRIKDDQGEAQRMALKEDESESSEEETRTLMTEESSEDESWDSASSSSQEETILDDDESTLVTKRTAITVHTKETGENSDDEEVVVKEESESDEDSDDLKWETGVQTTAVDALAVLRIDAQTAHDPDDLRRRDEEERVKRREEAHDVALERCRMRRRIVFNPKTYLPPVPIKTYQAMARGELQENKVFGTDFDEGEVLPETEKDVMQMVGFDASKDYNPGEMTKFAREAEKLCRKYRIGDYATGRAAESSDDSD